MPLTRDAVLLRIFIGENDKAAHQPFYEAIVLKGPRDGPCRRHHAARADGLRPFDYAAYHQDPAPIAGSATRHRDLDSEKKVEAFVAAIEPSGLVTTEKVEVIHYRDGGPCEPE